MFRAIIFMLVIGFSANLYADDFKAAELYQKSCDLDNGSGCVNLGVMHYNGDGVKKDVFKAVELYQKSCDLRVAVGCENYAKIPY